MSDHLPECESDAFESWQIEACICDRLRACEARVLHDALEQGYANGKSHGLLEGWQTGNAEGFAAGVSACRAAVAPLMEAKAPRHYYGGIHDALAAIDGVKP